MESWFDRSHLACLRTLQVYTCTYMHVRIYLKCPKASSEKLPGALCDLIATVHEQNYFLQQDMDRISCDFHMPNNFRPIIYSLPFSPVSVIYLTTDI